MGWPRRLWNLLPGGAFVKTLPRGIPMLEWILILLIIAAVAGLLGFNTISGVAMTGVKILIGILLVLFLLVVLAIVAIA